jgi:hypothetical protein
MKKAILEKTTVAVLFVLVIVVFSFAERDSKKLVQLYTKNPIVTLKKTNGYMAADGKARPKEITRN